MPVIVFEGPKMKTSQKAELVRSLTETASKITQIRTEAFTIIIKENERENIGVGGQLLSERK